ncbi:hypothetical protein Bcav_2212 [Beutenbergia cavernae DSM 12333]|uniref:Lipoprotein n=1 Tax=Beutenbergia cavernae (strain ATCC BAA-8 / DSM 12333 / CCUG 43141 / JCM 11478 / NBRC 16432 / NCIMB 13614 / HKI 0122) TaxID=471853 RepID=C5BV76_BEUC1|nr:hypothetical protein [Beutenbergia cavernae]ACQ80463.1 hypothetical protein Bcav_2212 [Beutenbergia cavernae DSM 12333]
MRRTAAVVGAFLALLALTACVPDDPTGDPTSGGPGSASSSSDGQHRTPKPNQLCDTADKGEHDLPEVDFADVQWTVPSGFVSSSAYSEEFPLEGDYIGLYAGPDDGIDTLNALGIVVYPQLELGPLMDACSRISDEAIDARLAQYHEIAPSTVLEGPDRTEVAGLPAVMEVLELPDYSWRTYWIFGRDQMMQVVCQWTDHRDRVEAACVDLVASIRFG